MTAFYLVVATYSLLVFKEQVYLTKEILSHSGRVEKEVFWQKNDLNVQNKKNMYKMKSSRRAQNAFNKYQFLEFIDN